MRTFSLSAPLLLLLYGILRFFGSLDGHTRGGWTWTVGHLAFFLGMTLFAALAAVLWERAKVLSTIGVAASVFGVGCFLWVIAGDLNAGFRDRFPLPSALETAGPLCFLLGMILLLSIRVADGRVPWWSPALFLAGFLAISVNLDLLPLAAVVVLVSMVPVARSGSRPRRLAVRRAAGRTTAGRTSAPAPAGAPTAAGAPVPGGIYAPGGAPAPPGAPTPAGTPAPARTGGRARAEGPRQ